MRGLAKQLKPKLDNPDAVCVYKTSGMRIEHLMPRLEGYICKDINAVVLYLGTNDISGSVNKVKKDINKMADTIKGFQYRPTHFYVTVPLPPQKKLKEKVDRYIEMPHILSWGDSNSRTGQAPDSEAGVIDTNVNVPNQRFNEDKVSNKYGQHLKNFCINTGFKIANGQMFNDNGIGRLTYYSPSTIDSDFK